MSVGYAIIKCQCWTRAALIVSNGRYFGVRIRRLRAQQIDGTKLMKRLWAFVTNSGWLWVRAHSLIIRHLRWYRQRPFAACFGSNAVDQKYAKIDGNSAPGTSLAVDFVVFRSSRLSTTSQHGELLYMLSSRSLPWEEHVMSGPNWSRSATEKYALSSLWRTSCITEALSRNFRIRPRHISTVNSTLSIVERVQSKYVHDHKLSTLNNVANQIFLHFVSLQVCLFACRQVESIH